MDKRIIKTHIQSSISINKVIDKMQQLIVEDLPKSNGFCELRLISEALSSHILAGSSDYGCIPKRHKLIPNEIQKYLDTLLNIKVTTDSIVIVGRVHKINTTEKLILSY